MLITRGQIRMLRIVIEHIPVFMTLVSCRCGPVDFVVSTSISSTQTDVLKLKCYWKFFPTNIKAIIVL